MSTTTTTRSRVVRSAGLVIAPLLVFGLAACGDDDDGGGDSAGGSTESFCNQIKDISDQGDEIEANSDDADPEELLNQVAGLVDQMQELDPPAEIEDDWNSALEILDGLYSGDVEDVANFQPTEEQAQAGERVGEYLRNECGLDEDSFLGS